MATFLLISKYLCENWVLGDPSDKKKKKALVKISTEQEMGVAGMNSKV